MSKSATILKTSGSADSSSSPSTVAKKYQYIDMLRGLAILGVIAVHSHQNIDGLGVIETSIFNFGQLGVQLFFIASAYTLCLSFNNRKETTVFYFYIRRFFRVAPLFYFGIIFYYLFRLFSSNYLDDVRTYEYSLSHIVQTITFVHGLFPSNYSHLVPGGWSISVEIFFYIIFPYLFIIFKNHLKLSLLLSLVLVILGVFAQYLIYNYIVPTYIGIDISNDQFGFLYASIFNQFGVFLIGIIAYFNFGYLQRLNKYLLYILMLLLFVCTILMQNDHHYDSSVDGAIYPLIASLGFSILLVLSSKLPSTFFVKISFLTSFGKNSYSIYLMHFFVLDLVRYLIKSINIDLSPLMYVLVIFLLVIVLVYLLSLLTNWLIEAPFISLGSRLIEVIKTKKYLNK